MATNKMFKLNSYRICVFPLNAILCPKIIFILYLSLSEQSKSQKKHKTVVSLLIDTLNTVNFVIDECIYLPHCIDDGINNVPILSIYCRRSVLLR